MTTTYRGYYRSFEHFISTKRLDKLTIVYLDNASFHRAKCFKEKCYKWLLKGPVIIYLPAYSPGLNIIELLWKKIKYEWLSCHVFITFETLKNSIKDMLYNY
ncbi:transposase [Shewanella sp. VB17]|uniref:transposase n=1 Tax=Shewanella sp. VB17 TaxID=2739432 RepID=UPI001563E5A6|nr:transposase [Shewanella sp. VB17]